MGMNGNTSDNITVPFILVNRTIDLFSVFSKK